MRLLLPFFYLVSLSALPERRTRGFQRSQPSRLRLLGNVPARATRAANWRRSMAPENCQNSGPERTTVNERVRYPQHCYLAD